MKKAAICFSGHTRDLSKCLDNIKVNLIASLISQGYSVDIFCSTWNTKGHRGNGWGSPLEPLGPLNPVKTIIEPFNRMKFLHEYKSENWNDYLSTWETSGDAASMWHQVKSAFELAHTQYDLYVRARYDIIYNQPVIIPEIKSNTVYMPISHGKYEVVTCGIMDHFAFGDYEAMKTYSSTIDNIQYFIQNQLGPFTAEGYLKNTLSNTNIIRIPLSYDVQREHHIDKVV